MLYAGHEHRRVLTALGLSVCLLAGCKHKRFDDRPLDGDNDKKVLAEESKLAAKGEAVGEKLANPHVVVDAATIRINGYPVGPRSGIAAGSLRRVDSVYGWMKGSREHWRGIYGSQPLFPGRADITLPADASFYEGASLVLTVMFAGFPNQTLHVGDRTLSLGVAIPQPPRVDDGAKPEARLELCYGKDWQVRRSVMTTASDVVATPWRAAPAAGLAGLVQELCASGCTELDVGVDSGTPEFHDALATITPVLGAQTKVVPSVNFQKCSLTAPVPTAAPAASGGKPPTIDWGAAPEVSARPR